MSTYWWRGVAVAYPINEVALCQARLVLGWATVRRQVNQPPRSTQPSTLRGMVN